MLVLLLLLFRPTQDDLSSCMNLKESCRRNRKTGNDERSANTVHVEVCVPRQSARMPSHARCLAADFKSEPASRSSMTRTAGPSQILSIFSRPVVKAARITEGDLHVCLCCWPGTQRLRFAGLCDLACIAGRSRPSSMLLKQRRTSRRNAADSTRVLYNPVRR